MRSVGPITSLNQAHQTRVLCVAYHGDGLTIRPANSEAVKLVSAMKM